jgi:hypothetical protein
LPKGVKQKAKKPRKQQGPKKGHGLSITPRKNAVVEQAKVSAMVSKLINEKNEKVVNNRADHAVGRNTPAAAKAKAAQQ